MKIFITILWAAGMMAMNVLPKEEAWIVAICWAFPAGYVAADGLREIVSFIWSLRISRKQSRR